MQPIAPYSVTPKALADLDEIADYLAQEQDRNLGLRFLTSAHKTFALLSTQPTWVGEPGSSRESSINSVLSGSGV